MYIYVYVLEDLMLNDNEQGIEYIKKLKGKLHIILGNHDSKKRTALYKTCSSNLVDIWYSTLLNYKDYVFYLSHYLSYL